MTDTEGRNVADLAAKVEDQLLYCAERAIGLEAGAHRTATREAAAQWATVLLALRTSPVIVNAAPGMNHVDTIPLVDVIGNIRQVERRPSKPGKAAS